MNPTHYPSRPMKTTLISRIRKSLLLTPIIIVTACGNDNSSFLGTYQTDSGDTPIEAIIIERHPARQKGIILYYVHRSPVANDTDNLYINSADMVTSMPNALDNVSFESSFGTFRLHDGIISLNNIDYTLTDAYEISERLIDDFENRIAEEEERIVKERERQQQREENPIEIEPYDYGFKLDGSRIDFHLKADLRNVSDKTWIVADFERTFTREGFFGGEIEDREPGYKMEIEFNKMFYLSDYEHVYSSDYFSTLPKINYENPWEPGAVMNIELVLFCRSFDEEDYLTRDHLRYEPKSCILYLPIKLEDPYGYKKNLEMKFDMKETFMDFALKNKSN